MAKTYKKQILRYGTWNHNNAPQGVLKIDKDYLENLVNNFKKSPFVPVTRGHQSQQDLEENPSLIVTNNIKDLEIDEKGLNAVMDINPEELTKYNDVSVSIEPNYEDHETGEKIGGLLRHVALVVNPYIKGLNPFVSLKENNEFCVINLSEVSEMTEEVKPVESVEETTVEEVKAEPEIAVDEAVVEEVKTEVTEEAKAEETVSEEPKEEAKEEVTEPVKEEVIEAEVKTEVQASDSTNLLKQIEELTAEKNRLAREIQLKDNSSLYDNLLKTGKVIPTQKEAFMQLCEASNNSIELGEGKSKTIREILVELFDNAPVLVEFGEKGVNIETGESAELVSIKADMRKRRPRMSDDEFEAYWAENYDSIKKSAQKFN